MIMRLSGPELATIRAEQLIEILSKLQNNIYISSRPEFVYVPGLLYYLYFSLVFIFILFLIFCLVSVSFQSRFAQFSLVVIV